jgi:hypothetical protein
MTVRNSVTIKALIIMEGLTPKRVERTSKRPVKFSEVVAYKEKLFNDFGQSLKMFTAIDNDTEKAFYQFRHKDFSHGGAN